MYSGACGWRYRYSQPPMMLFMSSPDTHHLAFVLSSMPFDLDGVLLKEVWNCYVCFCWKAYNWITLRESFASNQQLEPRLNCSEPCHQMGTRCLQQGHLNPNATGNEASKPNLCNPWLDRCSAKRTMCNTNSMTACVLRNSNQQSSKWQSNSNQWLFKQQTSSWI